MFAMACRGTNFFSAAPLQSAWLNWKHPPYRVCDSLNLSGNEIYVYMLAGSLNIVKLQPLATLMTISSSCCIYKVLGAGIGGLVRTVMLVILWSLNLKNVGSGIDNDVRIFRGVISRFQCLKRCCYFGSSAIAYAFILFAYNQSTIQVPFPPLI